VSTVAEAGDDEALLAALRQAVDGMRDVPPDFVEAGKKAFAWYNADAELAELTYDSARDSAAPAAVPAETASARALRFTAAHLAIELKVAADSLVGQVTPGQSATITVQRHTGDETELSTDAIGCFSVDPVPPLLFRLHVQAGPDVDVLTSWITLLTDPAPQRQHERPGQEAGSAAQRGQHVLPVEAQRADRISPGDVHDHDGRGPHRLHGLDPPYVSGGVGGHDGHHPVHPVRDVLAALADLGRVAHVLRVRLVSQRALPFP
jgi:hypothetical protein